MKIIMKYNISKLFYKDYYDKINFEYALKKCDSCKPSKQENITDNNEEIKKANEKILNAELVVINLPNEISPKECRFKMKVQYPGLITGIGLIHDLKKVEKAFNLGMHFDYTYGMPIIYGSSIKGMLSSYFTDYCPEKFDSRKLKEDIFDSVKPKFEQDVFFDAVILKANPNCKFLETDSITPHGKDPLTNPIPITMLKIAAGTTIEFRFKLFESKISQQIITIEDKLSIFKDILRNVGIGAKTNVGYGQLKG